MIVRKRPVVLVLVLVPIALAVTVPLIHRYAQRHWYATTKDGCWDVPLAPAVTPHTHPDSYRWPYGAVYSCKVLDSEAHLFGDADLSFTLVLETDAGPALVRMDYLNTDMGRQYVAQATELAPPAGAELTGEEVARIDRAIRIRGGLQPTPWVVHYGDG